MEFKDKIRLHSFREVKCWWEAGEVAWEGGKGGRRLERRVSGEVGRCEVPGFIQGWETQ